jgi:hypothetical protein
LSLIPVPKVAINSWFYLLLLLQGGMLSAAESDNPAMLGEDQLQWLGDQIYRNECNARPACLTSWNDGEEFPSLGIGHFIWYQAGQTARFEETFPGLLQHLQQSGVALPAWLQASAEQPWATRASFLADQDSPRMRELRSLLEATRSQQTAYIVQRFRQLQQKPDSALTARPDLQQKLQRVAAQQPPYGLYALIDYVHFKGEGINLNERYAGQGWGLMQVLEMMPNDSADPLASFVASAKAVLTRRVDNAPAERREERWLAGWHHRVETYLPAPALAPQHRDH